MTSQHLVDFGLLLSHSLTTTFTLVTPSSPPTTRINLPRCPPPLMRDVGPIKSPQLPSEARSHCSRPSPFQRDVGSLLSFEGDWGSEKHQGGPMKCVPKYEPRRLSWLIFPNSSFHPIPLTTIVPNASVSNDDRTGDYPKHDDMNPMKGLGAAQRGEPSHHMATNGNNDNGCSGSNDHSSSGSGGDRRKHRLLQQHPTYL